MPNSEEPANIPSVSFALGPPVRTAKFEINATDLEGAEEKSRDVDSSTLTFEGDEFSVENEWNDINEVSERAIRD